LRLVVDTNILYTYFWKNSFARNYMLRIPLILFSPEFALEEIKANRLDILKKTKISVEKFKILRTEIAMGVDFVSIEIYKEYLNKALNISPDPNDVDFFALALKLNIPIWSNDSALKKQNNVLVLSTIDILEKQEFVDIIFP
jgi:predicted nucleic acid-binding protein